ncbi:hypothetical protein LQV63_30600 [Paenibacillus profundus]|uniref:Uncharacterized protein n=1 Tax=Paenibacillus profundus TaxID=1173085 RepID=A0ABS8YP43_9BACL|nr:MULTISPECIES: hypothetical protein [Paenibacillus]MCE5173583.1 hypothetical protein [Paenibacillus profundus]
MKINLVFTNKGKTAIEKFNNEELIEIFARYSKTLAKHYPIDVTVPTELNQNIVAEGVITVLAENVKCDAVIFFKELARDIKIPLNKRLGGKLDTVYKIVVV